MDNTRIEKVLASYQEILEKRGNRPVRESEPNPDRSAQDRMFDHVLWMIHHLKQNPQYSNTKQNRWLGWIQGVLWAERLFTLEEQKLHNLLSDS